MAKIFSILFLIFSSFVFSVFFCSIKALEGEWVNYSQFSLCYYLNTNKEIIDLINNVSYKEVSISAKYPEGTFLDEYTKIIFKKNKVTLKQIDKFFSSKKYTKYEQFNGDLIYKKHELEEYIVKEDAKNITILFIVG